MRKFKDYKLDRLLEDSPVNGYNTRFKTPVYMIFDKNELYHIAWQYDGDLLDTIPHDFDMAIKDLLNQSIDDMIYINQKPFL